MADSLSSCCRAPVSVYQGTEGTGSFECTACKKPCDAVPPHLDLNCVQPMLQLSYQQARLLVKGVTLSEAELLTLLAARHRVTVTL